MRLANQATHIWEDYYVEREDPNGSPYYWLAGNIKQRNEPDTDLSTVQSGYTSVTPLQLDMTKKNYFKQLAQFVPGLES